MLATVTLDLGPHAGAAHLLLEALAYGLGFALLRRQRRAGRDPLPEGVRFRLVVATVLGAALGAKALHHLASPSTLAETLADPRRWLEGKTVVGALLGGLMATELAKRRLGVRRSTGDAYALPIAVGIAVGRVGCLLAGLDDGTFGSPTTGPWAVDHGDGVARHPVALFESLGMGAVALGLWATRSRPWAEGVRFRLVLGSYCALRFAVDLLRPVEPVPGWERLGLGGRGPGVSAC